MAYWVCPGLFLNEVPIDKKSESNGWNFDNTETMEYGLESA